MKFVPTKIVGVERAVSGSDRGKYFCTAVNPPKRLPGTPGDGRFEKAVQKAVGSIKYLTVECNDQTPLNTWINSAIRKVRSRAIERGMECDLEHSDLEAIMESQKMRCALTGAKFDLNVAVIGKRRPFAPSVDRIDNSFGYIVGNIRITTVISNIARQDFGDEAFFKMCADTALHQGLVRITRTND